MSGKLVIRFDGPPSPPGGRFVEVELDGASVDYGEWERDDDGYWLLVLPNADAEAVRLKMSEAAAVERMNTAEDAMADMMQSATQTEAAMSVLRAYLGKHKAHPHAPVLSGGNGGGTVKCACHGCSLARRALAAFGGKK